jgi:hydroxymethylpyrimidine/phosphomethylpyrimidine kinase
LLPQEAVRELRELLIPSATVLTPNIPEAKLLLSNAGQTFHELQNVDDLISLAKAVQSLGPKFVVVKGGHLPFKADGTVAKSDAERELMVGILYGEGEVTTMASKYRKSKNTHGTCCSLACKCYDSIFQMRHHLTFSAAIASNLANGQDVIHAVKNACRYVEAGIKTSTDLGHGNGPINHFHSTYTLPFSP